MRFFYFYLYLIGFFLVVLVPFLRRKTEKKLFLFYCILLSLVTGLRSYTVGNDTPGYSFYFSEEYGWYVPLYGTIRQPYEDMEWGFVFVTRLLHNISSSPTFLFLVTGFGLWMGVYLLYRKSNNPLLSVLTLITVNFYFFGLPLAAVRQTLSLAELIFAFYFFEKSFQKSKIIKEAKFDIHFLLGALLLILSILTHRSTIFTVVILLLLLLVKFNRTRSTILLTISLTISLLGQYFLKDWMLTVFSYVSLVDYKNIALLGERYSDILNNTGIEFNTLKTISWAIPCYATIYCLRESKFNDFGFKIYIVAVCLMMLLCFQTNGMRMAMQAAFLGFASAIPSICKRDRYYYFLYVLFVGAYLVFDYRLFARWPTYIDHLIPYYFIWQ